MDTNKPIRLGVAGGNRGTAFNDTLALLKDELDLYAICDVDEAKTAEWAEKFPGIKTYTDYAAFIEDPDLDAVFIATPVQMHYTQTMQALKAGKHVLCEVYAADSIAELEDIVRTVEETGLTYMMAENYVFMRQNMLVLQMAQSGAFGDITYAEGGYVHDCRPIRIDEAGNVTWRGAQMRTIRGNTYPTHSLGPVAKWMGLTERDEMVRSSTFVSKQASMDSLIRERYGEGHPALEAGYWAHGDSVVTVIECASGTLVVLRFDGDSQRPHNMVHYQLQGTRAAYLSGRYDGEDGLLWVKGVSGEEKSGVAAGWDNMYKHAYAYEHPLWKQYMPEARRFGHGGGDFFVLRDFARAVRTGARPMVDVYDAAAWSSIVPVSIESVQKGGVPISIPRFARKK